VTLKQGRAKVLGPMLQRRVQLEKGAQTDLYGGLYLLCYEQVMAK
jgi:hypothetical protein